MNHERDWQRLIELLGPTHMRAVATARRLAASPSDGDDLFQEAVIRAYEKLSSLRDPDRFGSWFYSILLSIHRSRSRRSFWRRFLPLDQEPAAGFDPPGEDGGGWEDERRQAERVSRALALLPAVQREAIVLFELDRYSIAEIASMQSASASSVKSRLARARGRLRRHYERLGFTPQPSGERHEEMNHEGPSMAVIGGEETCR